MAEFNKPIREKIWNEAERSLGLREDTKGDPQGYVESFLKRYADNESNMIYQAVVLDPIQKPSRPSQPCPTKLKPLSAKMKRKLGLLQIPKTEQKYGYYKPLHELWTKYMLDLLRPTPHSNTRQLAQKVLKADLHGCDLEVVRSKCTSNVGLAGIVLQETQNTFRLINSDNRILTIPKAHTVFQFTLKDHKFLLYGDNLKYRASDRAARKFKDRHLKDFQL